MVTDAYRNQIIEAIVDYYGNDYRYDIEEQADEDLMELVLDVLEHIKELDSSYRPFRSNREFENEQGSICGWRRDQ